MTTQPSSLIVALGAGLEKRNPGDPPYTWIGTETELRAAAAAKIFGSRQDALLIFSGGRLMDKASPSEAESMKDYVMRPPWNVPENRIATEDASIDTASNVANVAAIIEARSLPTKNVTLIAGRRNVERAAAYFRAYGIRVTPLLARNVLGEDIERLGLPVVSDEPTFTSLFHEYLLRLEQLVDRKGRLITMIKRWQRSR